MSTITIPKILANFETSLAATMSAAATSLTLNASVDGDGTTLSGLYSLTFDEGTSSEDHMLVTMTGAAGTVSRRGLSRVDAYTEVTANKLVHNRGASVKVTNVSAINIQRLLNGDETFNSVAWTGVASIAGLSTPGAGEVTKAASVAYVNAVAIAGASDATTTTKGIVEEATQAEIAAGTAAGATAARLFTNPSTLAPHIQSGAWLSAVEDGTGSDDTYTAALTPALTAYTTGMMVNIKLTVANTGACTLNLNGLGAKNIKKYVAGAQGDPETGDIVANQFCMFYYDGTSMVLLNPSAAMPTTTNLQSITTNFPTLVGGVASNADTLHKHVQVACGTGTYNGTGTNGTVNDDDTITLTFQPSVIEIDFILQGHTSASETADYRTIAGTILYEGTTQKGVFYLNSNFDADATDGAAITAVNMTRASLTSSTALSIGSASGTNAVQMKMLVNSVSATGFVIRRQKIANETNAIVARADYMWKAWR